MTRRLRCSERAALVLVSSLLCVAIADAGEQRAIDPILRPSAAERARAAQGAAPLLPVDAARVRKGVEQLYAAWNDGRLGDHLADDFFDKTRLLDAVNERVPRDASLRVLEIAGIQTLQQQIDAARGEVVSLVAVTVRSQLEFQDPQQGFVRREGRNELLVRVREPAPRSAP